MQGTFVTAESRIDDSRPRLSRVKLGVSLFVTSDALTFAALLFGYAYLRSASPEWPQPFDSSETLPRLIGMTLVLFGSGLAMSLAARRAEIGALPAAIRWLRIAAVGGAIFVLLHLEEWRSLVGHGVTMRANPWGEPLFGATFYTLTGFHMLHVLGGIVVLSVLARRATAGRASAEGIGAFGIYWHFVEIVWLFILPLVYLLSLGGVR